jgi:glycine cleavage system H protein
VSGREHGDDTLTAGLNGRSLPGKEVIPMVAALVALAIVALILLDALVIRKRRSDRTSDAVNKTGVVPLDALQWKVSIPEGLFLSDGHAWGALERTGRVRVGMDTFAWQMMGPPDGLELPTVGTRVKAGEPLVRMYKDKGLAHLSAPTEGIVEDVNVELSPDPSRAAHDPYGAAWFVLLKPTRLDGDLPSLHVAAGARTYLQEEVDRFRAFVRDYQEDFATAADGGKPVDGIVPCLGGDAWDRFRRDFMRERI